MSHQYATLEDTVYFFFVSNDTSGSGADGTTPLFDIRLGGATASDAAILSGTPDLLTNAGYGPGAYEVAIAATASNGFAADNTYGVFVTATVDSQTPGAALGSFTLTSIADAVWDEAMIQTTGAPTVTGTFRSAIEWVFALSRNKMTQNSTTSTLRNDADDGDLATSTISDSSGTATRGEWST